MTHRPSANRGFFVTGTGTGVGKTFVTAMLAEQARAAGQRVFAFKPIETGCSLCEGSWVGADQELLAKAAGDWQQDELRRLYCFERPISPLGAARAEGRTIELDRIKAAFARGCEQSDYVLVEGAGGWRVPITEHHDMSRLAKATDLPVLVVAMAGLGTINHSVLTVEAVRNDGCAIAGVVLSCRPEDDLQFARDNAAEIARLGQVRAIVSCEKVLYDTL
ncbi:MAG: dethiobiotin synthase [Myxococcota bacterium]|nr:dethiobiotin synthase [Deltaproteobacteria bacterium]MDQ3338553.1 dethiobiotin synthase [Myxococcota bacterium]